MKPLFFKKSSLWSTLLLAGMLFAAIGIVYSGSNLQSGKTGTEGGPPTSKAASENALKPEDESKSSESNVRSGETGEKTGPSGKRGSTVGERKPNDYFVEYRLERDRTRSQQVDWFREIVNNQNSGEEARREAQKRLLGITQAVETEMKIESLLKAQNFKDAVVIINDKSATVIVQVPMLTAADKIKITEIAAKITGFSEQSIEIIAKV